MNEPSEIRHQGPVCFQNIQSDSSFQLSRITAWEAGARVLGNEDDVKQAMQSYHESWGLGLRGCVMLRALEEGPDGSMNLVETTHPLSTLLEDGVSRPFSDNDVVDMVGDFHNYLMEAYPGRILHMEMLTGREFINGVKVSFHRPFVNSVGRDVVDKMDNFIASCTEKGDHGDVIRGIGGINGSTKITVSNGRVSGFEFAPDKENGAVAPVNVHQLIPAADGAPIKVPQIMQDWGFDAGKTKAFMHQKRQNEEVVAQVETLASALTINLRIRGFPGWEEDTQAIRERVDQFRQAKGIGLLLKGRRLIEEMTPVLATINKQIHHMKDSNAQTRKEDRLFGRRDRSPHGPR